MTTVPGTVVSSKSTPRRKSPSVSVQTSDADVDAPSSTAAGVSGFHPRSMRSDAIFSTLANPIITTTVMLFGSSESSAAR